LLWIRPRLENERFGECKLNRRDGVWQIAANRPKREKGQLLNGFLTHFRKYWLSRRWVART
jgi:hypothetical protein